MRILQVINSMGTGGAEKLLCDTLPLYLERGIKMDVLLLVGTEHPFFLKLKSIPGIRVYTLGNGSPYNPLYIFKIIPYLRKYDIVHVHLFPSLYWVAISKALSFSKVKLIFTEHNTTNRRRSNALLSLFDSWIYRKYQNIVTISTSVDQQLKDHLKLDAARFRLIQNGVNLDAIKNARPLSKSNFGATTAKILVQVSSFTSQKDQLTLIKSIQYVTEDVLLLLVGDGSTINESKALVKELGLNDVVQFLGIRMDVPSLLKTADIIILSSFFEGLSLSSIEGLASGKPFVASKAPGLLEIVSGAGVLFDIENEKQLSEAINKLFDDEIYYNEITQKCLRRAEDFHIHKMIDSHITLYKQILKIS